MAKVEKLYVHRAVQVGAKGTGIGLHTVLARGEVVPTRADLEAAEKQLAGAKGEAYDDLRFEVGRIKSMLPNLEDPEFVQRLVNKGFIANVPPSPETKAEIKSVAEDFARREAAIAKRREELAGRLEKAKAAGNKAVAEAYELALAALGE